MLLAAIAAGVLWWRTSPTPRAATGRPGGGALVATIRSDPRTFNRLLARDRASHVVSLLTQARLVRINLATQQVEPGVAERWEVSPDGRVYTFHLRRGVTFSDGVPMTAADVEFSFRALFDPALECPVASTLMAGGQPPSIEVVDARTVRIAFAAPFATAIRLLDSVPVLPAHRLASHLADGTFATAWSVTTPPDEIVSLGPFVLVRYAAGERLEFERNPHYWKRDADGQPLPYLDRLTLLVVPDQNGEMLRLENGEADVLSGDSRPEDIAALRRARQAGRVELWEPGIGLDPDFLWFNLRPEVQADPARAWLTNPLLREAISLGVDRRAFANVVYLGNAEPVDAPITPGHLQWYDPSRPRTPHDPARAAALLAEAGLIDRDGDGARETQDGRPAAFTIATQKGNVIRERGATFLQGQLAALGLAATVVPLETGALIQRVTSGDYEAAWFGTVSSDSDPGNQLDFWRSSGTFHVWNPGQRTPASDWERRIDELMGRFVATPDAAQRRALFREVQREFDAAHPALYFAAPRVVIATSSRVRNVRPALLQPFVLWDAERLQVGQGPR